ncbi:MAG: type II toxin-antitoxin system VapC family toxin [Rhizomicrobium sp.]
MYLIDTDVLSAARKLPPDHPVVVWLRSRSAATYISVVTVMEIERGVEKQRRIDPPFAADLEAWLSDTLTIFDSRVLPITMQIARRWGRLQTQLARADNDLPIAATALEHDLQIVTRNVRHFDQTGVVIVNPFEG